MPVTTIRADEAGEQRNDGLYHALDCHSVRWARWGRARRCHDKLQFRLLVVLSCTGRKVDVPRLHLPEEPIQAGGNDHRRRSEGRRG